MKRKRKAAHHPSVSEATSVKSTGGEGYSFEDWVAGFFMVHMLAGLPPFQKPAGRIQQIDFQTRDLGWTVDDLLLTLGTDGAPSRCALSVKSNSQVTQQGFPADFVEDVWRQWQLAGSPFQAQQDFVGLVTSRLSQAVRTAWDALAGQLQVTPARAAKRATTSGGSSKVQRSLFKSFHRPTSVPADSLVPVKTEEVLARVLLLHHDFERQDSVTEGRAIQLCRESLRSGSTDQAGKLWKRLKELAKEARPKGGSYSLHNLIAELRNDFQLLDYPDHGEDWRRLDAISREARNAIRREVGVGCHLDRTDLIAEIERVVSTSGVVAVVGGSGAGKSAAIVELSNLPAFDRVLWIEGGHFSPGGLSMTVSQLGLTHPFQELLENSSVSCGLLVADSIDRFSSSGLAQACELIRVALGSRWKIILTSQVSRLDRVLHAIIAAGVQADSLYRLEVSSPTPEQILRLADSVPNLVSVLAIPELPELLRNLKVLDWVARGLACSPQEARSGLASEAALIEWVWDGWVGVGPNQYERDAVLLKIGELEAASLGATVSIADFASGERTALRQLEDDEIVRVRGTEVLFRHDLTGDWARLRRLSMRGPTVIATIREVADRPGWQRAIQLYASGLLDQPDGTAQWLSTIADFDGGSVPETHAVDLFLDALFLSANSERSLDQLWQWLLVEKGNLLRRLLRRFLHAGTLPDTNVLASVAESDADWVSAHIRVPYPPYWFGMLRALAKHGDDVVCQAMFLGAEICELWLRVVSPRSRFRSDASRLALLLAKEAQALHGEGMIFEDNSDRKIYEAALWALPDLPEDVCTFALEMSCRRADPLEVLRRQAARAERERLETEEWRARNPEQAARLADVPFGEIGIGPDYGPPNPVCQDQPNRRISESFREAVLETHALSPMILFRPQSAREVILAVCIEPPGQRNSVISDEYGMESWPGGSPAMFFRGPFLTFLQTNAEEGIETILRLVNYATDCWSASEQTDASVPGLDIPLEAGTVFWSGNLDVYGWYRNMLGAPSAVTSALMALEKWLYDEIDQNRAVDSSVRQIFAASRSMAFLGVLTALALRTPELLKGCLRPLLGIVELYGLQFKIASQEGHFDPLMGIAWYRSGEKVFNMAKDWHGLAHRRRLLQASAVNMLLTDPAIAEYLAARRSEWLKQGSSMLSRDAVERMVAILDPANYSVAKNSEGEEQLLFQLPPSLHGQTKALQLGTEQAIRWQLFPSLCRSILSDRKTLEDDEVADLWDTLQSIAAGGSTDDPAETQIHTGDGVAGGVAVLLVRQREWLDRYPERLQWCLEKLRTMATPTRLGGRATTIDTDAAEAFLAEAALSLPALGFPAWARMRVAGGIMGHCYSSIQLTMEAAFADRKRLGNLFGETLNLSLMGAGLRYLETYCHNCRIDTRYLVPMVNRLLQAYTKGRVARGLLSFPDLERWTSNRAKRLYRKRTPSMWDREPADDSAIQTSTPLHRSFPKVSLEAIENTFAFLAVHPEGFEEDRDGWIAYHKTLLDLSLESLSEVAAVDQRIDGTPWGYDRWIFARVARLVARLGAGSEANALWRPILDLGGAAHYWVEDFLREWFTHGLDVARDSEEFAAIWRDMISNCLLKWDRRSPPKGYHLAEISCHLMGLDPLLKHTRKTSRFIEAIGQIADLYGPWAERWLGSSYVGREFAAFLATEAGAQLLSKGIQDLHAAATRYDNNAWRTERLAEAFAEALRACWRSQRRKIESDDSLQRAFLGLLGLAVNAQERNAQELQTEVVSALNRGSR